MQRRLGHESITTTSDTYGHLLETARTAALVTIDRVMGFTPPARAASQENGSGYDGGAVYVAHIGAWRAAFWDSDDAEGTAERWVREHGGSVHVEKMTSDGWIGTVDDGASADNALKSVRTQTPRRAWVWEAGPAVYTPDGSEVVTNPSAAKLRGSWRWDFEDLYTEELSPPTVERRIGPQTQTIARAWGRDEDSVREAFAEARADALRIRSLNSAAGTAREGARSVF
ncbi:hypothetical protein OG957_12370 [Streptomyces sp. NBC_01718]